MKQRCLYAIIVLLVIISGILSRKVAVIPACTGDLLYAVMMYFMIRFLSVRSGIIQVAVISLCICFAIELSQLYQAPRLNHIRSTLAGRLVLGQGFLWSDLLAYAFGIILAGFADRYIGRSK